MSKLIHFQLFLVPFSPAVASFKFLNLIVDLVLLLKPFVEASVIGYVTAWCRR